MDVRGVCEAAATVGARGNSAVCNDTEENAWERKQAPFCAETMLLLAHGILLSVDSECDSSVCSHERSSVTSEFDSWECCGKPNSDRTSGFVAGDLEACKAKNQVAMQYVDQRYPINPNGSPEGITAITANKGRVLALMPHPERGVALSSMSWAPAEAYAKGEKGWQGKGPWFRMFENARKWVGSQQK